MAVYAVDVVGITDRWTESGLKICSVRLLVATTVDALMGIVVCSVCCIAGCCLV